MKQEDVDKIYAYLHEHYEYKNGELIRKFKCKKSGSKKGKILGSFAMHSKKPVIKATIVINGTIFSKPLSHFIFLYHNKKLPDYIEHINENTVDCNIENIKEITRKDVEGKKTGFKGFEQIETKNGLRYRVSITTNKNKAQKKIHLGSYPTTEEATKIYNHAKKLHLIFDNPDELKSELKKEFPDIRIKVKKNKNNLSGVHKSGKNFKSSICINGVVKYLGSFKNEIEAHESYLKARKEVRG